MLQKDQARPSNWRVLAGFLALSFAVSAAGGWITAGSVETWYPTLAKPSFNPPDWVFAPVWTVLYGMMAVSAWLVWRRAGFAGARIAFILYGGQLALNLLWSATFFGLRNPPLALVVIALLLGAIGATGWAFRRYDARAALLLVPYLIWTCFAAVLNGAIVALN
jgi:benzodiazapine receptor